MWLSYSYIYAQYFTDKTNTPHASAAQIQAAPE